MKEEEETCRGVEKRKRRNERTRDRVKWMKERKEGEMEE